MDKGRDRVTDDDDDDDDNNNNIIINCSWVVTQWQWLLYM